MMEREREVKSRPLAQRYKGISVTSLPAWMTVGFQWDDPVCLDKYFMALPRDGNQPKQTEIRRLLFSSASNAMLNRLSHHLAPGNHHEVLMLLSICYSGPQIVPCNDTEDMVC